MTETRACTSPTPPAPIAPDPESPDQHPSGVAARDAAPVASAAATAYDLADGVFGVAVPGAAEVEGFDRVARFSHNLFGETQLATGVPARVVAAGVETAAEVGASEVVEQAMGARASALGAAVSLLDAHLPEHSALGPLTSIATALDPSALAADAASLLVDATTATAFGGADRLADLGALERDLVVGSYGAPLQGAALAGRVITGDRAAGISDEAARGDHGRLVAWGNAAGDLWSDLAFGEAREPRTVPVAEAERRETFVGALFGD